MTYDRAFAARCHEAGASLVAFVSDVQLLTDAAAHALAEFKAGAPKTNDAAKY